jgi:hypothetical protein
MQIDFGDVVAHLDLRVKGARRLRIRVRVGAPRDTTAADRAVKGPPYATHIEKKGPIMDLQADKKFSLGLDWTDELGNTVDVPEDATAVWTVDDPTVLNVTDNGDGTGEAAATGTLGAANVHVEATSGGKTFTGDLAVMVVAGLAERVNVVAGDPEEVTPDA